MKICHTIQTTSKLVMFWRGFGEKVAIVHRYTRSICCPIYYSFFFWGGVRLRPGIRVHFILFGHIIGRNQMHHWMPLNVSSDALFYSIILLYSQA
jgi:hypothetical protein